MQSFNTWAALEAAYFAAMKRADWHPDDNDLAEMWSHVVTEDLLIISQYLAELARLRAATERLKSRLRPQGAPQSGLTLTARHALKSCAPSGAITGQIPLRHPPTHSP